jgi:hypothetical protein
LNLIGGGSYSPVPTIVVEDLLGWLDVCPFAMAV